MQHLYLRLLIALPLLFCACFARAQSTNIVGGGNTNINAVPWQVLLEIGGIDQCGGVIIAPDWILTAAHCTTVSPSQIVVFASLSDRTQKATAQRRTVVEIIRHPSYNPSGSNQYEHDIALLRLSSPLTLNLSARPIAYATPEERAAGLTNTGVNATVSGWGFLTETGPQPLDLQSVQVPIADNATAAAQYNTLPSSDRVGVTDNMIAAGLATGGRDACNGDSGGPLVVRDGTGLPILAGIVSFGRGCARPNFLGIYTRVSSYYNWIVSQTASLCTGNLVLNNPTGANYLLMCNGESTTFSATVSGAVSNLYRWQTTGGLTMPNGATTVTNNSLSMQVTVPSVGWGFGRIHLRARTWCGVKDRYWDVYYGIPSPNITGPTTTYGSEVIVLQANTFGQSISSHQWSPVNKVAGWRWATGTTASEVRIFWETATQPLTVKVTTVNRCGTQFDTHTIQPIGVAPVKVAVSPNPANGSFAVQYENPAGGDEEAELVLYDFRGRVVQRSKTIAQNADFNTSGLPQGLYTLQVVSKTSTLTKRVQVKH